MDTKKNKTNIYDFYRQTLKRPDLSNKEIDKMRESVQLVVRAICEHVWGEDFY